VARVLEVGRSIGHLRLGHGRPRGGGRQAGRRKKQLPHGQRGQRHDAVRRTSRGGRTGEEREQTYKRAGSTTAGRVQSGILVAEVQSQAAQMPSPWHGPAGCSGCLLPAEGNAPRPIGSALSLSAVDASGNTAAHHGLAAAMLAGVVADNSSGWPVQMPSAKAVRGHPVLWRRSDWPAEDWGLAALSLCWCQASLLDRCSLLVQPLLPAPAASCCCLPRVSIWACYGHGSRHHCHRHRHCTASPAVQPHCPSPIAQIREPPAQPAQPACLPAETLACLMSPRNAS
jgi:hypothetical protein